VGSRNLTFRGEPSPNEEINFTEFGKRFVDFILKEGK